MFRQVDDEGKSASFVDLWDKGFGGILADEMGLGKSVVRAKRWSAVTCLTDLATFVAWFLMYCASSSAISAKWQAA